MAFVAVQRDGRAAGEIAGEVRAFVHPGGVTAEFAILVRSDVKRRGLGRALLAKMIDYCRASGLTELIGQILPQNAAMIALARRCGMQVETVPGASVAIAHIALRPDAPAA
jgi:acetyltransferase